MPSSAPARQRLRCSAVPPQFLPSLLALTTGPARAAVADGDQGNRLALSLNSPATPGSSAPLLGPLDFENTALTPIPLSGQPLSEQQAGQNHHGRQLAPLPAPISLSYTGSIASVALYNGGALDSCPRVHVTLYGAGGSPSTWGVSYQRNGGSGGRVSATLTLPPGTTTLYALVGQRGHYPARTAAWPDGGKGGPDQSNTGGGGGGRTALRLSSGGEDILTAGGGGGGGYW